VASAVQLQGIMLLQRQGGIMKKQCLLAEQKCRKMSKNPWKMSKRFFVIPLGVPNF
jgi:hypothetical protein